MRSFGVAVIRHGSRLSLRSAGMTVERVYFSRRAFDHLVRS